MDKGLAAVVIYSVINAWAGLLLLGVGIPFYLKRIRPNTWAGMRTDATLSDPETWYAANRTMGLTLMLAGGAILAASLATFLLARQMSFLTLVVINLGVVMVAVTAVVASTLWTFRRKDRTQI